MLIVASPGRFAQAARQSGSGRDAENENRITIVYGADDEFRPFEWRTDNGSIDGFQIELIRAVAREAGFDLRVAAGPWPEIRSGLERGEIDVVAMTVHESRRMDVLFCESFGTIHSGIFIRRGGPQVNALEDLNEMTAIVEEAALADDVLESLYPSVRRLRVKSEGEAIRRLAAGEADCAIVTEFGGRFELKRQGREQALTITGPPVLGFPVAFAVRKDRADLRDALNAAQRRVRASPEYNALYDKWFGGLSRPSVPLSEVVRVGAWIGTPLMLLAIAFVAWNRSLKRQVARQTADLQRELQERRRIETELRESEARFLLALQDASIMVSTQDAELRYTWAYSALSCFPSREGLIGKTDLELIGGAKGQLLTTLKRRVLESGAAERKIIECPNGPSGRTIEFTVEPLRDEAGKTVGVATAAVDVTDLREQEFHVAELEKRLLELHQVDSLGLLAGGVAHDFNNLLSAVRAHAAMARDATGQELQDHLSSIEQVSEQAAEITRQLVAYAGRGAPLAQEVGLGDLARQVVRLARPALATHVTFDLEQLASGPSVRVETGQVRQAVLNLLKNSADAIETGRGTGLVRVTTREQHLDAAQLSQATLRAGAQPGRFACLSVEDDGPGVALDVLSRIFEPFVTTKGGSRGTGLGLAVVAGAMRRHAGAIFVQSTPGRGTTMTLCFPLNAVVGVPERVTTPRPGKTAVVLIESSPVVRGVMTTTLHAAGYDVHAALDPADLPAKLATIGDGLGGIIVDADSPAFDWRRFVDITAADQNGPEHSAARIIICGSSSALAKIPTPLGRNVVSLVKPFRPEQLARTLAGSRPTPPRDAPPGSPKPVGSRP
ncbi:MAG: transporter substrate-binding domain-containing protein [Planctomycetota bacterium]|nr:transporter substrate-binding domain-containing protein [Planctomycetota bacterium]